jgi:hypothetical protein
MIKWVESNDRGPADYFHFAACFFGLIICAAGVVTLSPATVVVGGLLVGLGLIYFLLVNDEN